MGHGKRRWYREPKELQAMPESCAERLYAKCVREGDCLLFTGSRNAKGYGMIKVAGRCQYAHRVAWVLAHKCLPPTVTIDHICRNANCCNVMHMRLLSLVDNVLEQHRARAEDAARMSDAAVDEMLAEHVPWLAGSAWGVAV